MRLRGSGLALLVGAFVLATQAGAAARSRVGILQFKGPGEGPVRAKVTKAVKANGFQIVGAKQLESTAGKLGVSLDADDGFRAVAKELNVSAFVTGELTKKKAALAVRNGADGAETAQAAFPGANPKKIKAAVAAGFWRQLGSAVKQGQPPSGAKAKSEVAEEAEPADDEANDAEAGKVGAQEPAKASSEDDEPKRSSKKERVAAKNEDADASGDDEGKAARHSRKQAPKESEEAPAEAKAEGADAFTPVALELGLGGRALFRNLTWNQDPKKAEVPYGLAPGPEAGLWLDFYPAALLTDGVAAQIGLFGSFNHGFGVVSTTGTGAQLTTSFQDYLAGLKFRLPLGGFTPYLSFAYGEQTFLLQGQTGTSIVPGVDYKFIRAGLGARLNYTKTAFFDLNVAYLAVSDAGSQAGQIESRASNFFPNTKAYAVEAGASAGFHVTGAIGVRLGVDVRQYGLDFNVQPTDNVIVGGATDRYIAFWGGLEIVLDGTSSGGDEREQESGQEPAAEKETPPPRPASKARSGHKAKKAEPEEEDDDAG